MNRVDCNRDTANSSMGTSVIEVLQSQVESSLVSLIRVYNARELVTGESSSDKLQPTPPLLPLPRHRGPCRNSKSKVTGGWNWKLETGDCWSTPSIPRPAKLMVSCYFQYEHRMNRC